MLDGIQKIIDRISDIFTIFDFSYFISGVASFSILCYGLWETQLLQWSEHLSIDLLAGIGLSYLCGLLSFSIGKYLRLWYIKYKEDKVVRERFMECFQHALSFVNEKKDLQQLNRYTSTSECELYYTEMWLFLRQHEAANQTLAFLNRYWVMQAVYEGLVTSSVIGFITGGILLFATPFHWVHFLILPIAFFAFTFCCREATRYAETQIKEVVIAYHFFLNQPH